LPQGLYVLINFSAQSLHPDLEDRHYRAFELPGINDSEQTVTMPVAMHQDHNNPSHSEYEHVLYVFIICQDYCLLTED
jgi:hypothetical protein